MARPKKNPKEVRVPITAAVLPDIEAELQSIAVAQDRTKSAIAEKLLLRGLAAFKEDGKLNADSLKTPTRTSSTTPLKPKRRKAIEDALDAAMGLNGKPLSKKDRDTLRKKLEEEEEEEEE